MKNTQRSETLETSEHQISLFAEDAQSSAQESHASQQASPVSEEARAMTVGSGRQCSIVVGSVNPDWCIFENPPGILLVHEFKEVYLHLVALGYDVRGFDVPAESVGADFLGWRTFIVAAPKRLQRASRPLPGSEQTQERWPPSQPGRRSRWETYAPVPRVAYGIPRGKHYLSSLGNSVAPEQAYPFFQAIAQT